MPAKRRLFRPTARQIGAERRESQNDADQQTSHRNDPAGYGRGRMAELSQQLGGIDDRRIDVGLVGRSRNGTTFGPQQECRIVRPHISLGRQAVTCTHRQAPVYSSSYRGAP